MPIGMNVWHLVTHVEFYMLLSGFLLGQSYYSGEVMHYRMSVLEMFVGQVKENTICLGAFLRMMFRYCFFKTKKGL